MSFLKDIFGGAKGAKTDKAATGAKGEQEAERVLKKNGYTILERNYRCRQGEIDIIASEAGAIVFVEVKTRTSDRFGTPMCSVGARKQRRMTIAAETYLNRKGLQDSAVRFDCVSIEIKGGRMLAEIIRDAFEAQE